MHPIDLLALSESDRSLLLAVRKLHSQTRQPVSPTEIERDLRERWGLPPERRTMEVIRAGLARLIEANVVVSIERRHRMCYLPTVPDAPVTHMVSESVSLFGNVPFVHCETCATGLTKPVALEDDLYADKRWARQVVAFRKKHPASFSS